LNAVFLFLSFSNSLMHTSPSFGVAVMQLW
jgi:hypothetical protein